jgi:hypothetical protein
MKMEMIVTLFRRIHVDSFSWKIPSEFRIVIEWPITLGNTEAQHDPITQLYIYNFSVHSQSPAHGHDCRQQATRQVGCCDRNLLAAKFSKCESLVVIVWAYMM